MGNSHRNVLYENKGSVLWPICGYEDSKLAMKNFLFSIVRDFIKFEASNFTKKDLFCRYFGKDFDQN